MVWNCGARSQGKIPARNLMKMKDNASGVSERVDPLRGQCARPHESFAVVKGHADTQPTEYANLQPSTIGHREPGIRVVPRETAGRAGRLECRRRVGHAKNRVCKRSQAGGVAPFELWPAEKIEQSWVDFRALCHGRTWRLGAAWCECDRALIVTKMRGEVAHDTEVAIEIAGDPGIKTPPSFV